jgi:hypothetical protein
MTNYEPHSPLSDIHLAKMEIAWFNPAKLPPPFDMKLLLMVAGSTSHDAGQTWNAYTLILTGEVLKTSPSDEHEDASAYDEWMASDQTQYGDFQFELSDGTSSITDGLEDWLSDSIVAWAYYPVAAGQAAIDASKKAMAAVT